mgnify:CR=1 FL=1
MRVASNYADVLVIRHPRDGAAKLAAIYANVPVVNGGDGAHEHPTQTLCDLFTLMQEGKKLKNLNMAISGDLRGSRTIHSFVYALARFGASDCDCNAHLFFFDTPPDFAAFEQRALPPSGQRRRIFRATDLTAAIPEVLQRRTGTLMEQPT